MQIHKTYKELLKTNNKVGGLTLPGFKTYCKAIVLAKGTQIEKRNTTDNT